MATQGWPGVPNGGTTDPAQGIVEDLENCSMPAASGASAVKAAHPAPSSLFTPQGPSRATSMPAPGGANAASGAVGGDVDSPMMTSPRFSERDSLLSSTSAGLSSGGRSSLSTGLVGSWRRSGGNAVHPAPRLAAGPMGPSPTTVATHAPVLPSALPETIPPVASVMPQAAKNAWPTMEGLRVPTRVDSGRPTPLTGVSSPSGLQVGFGGGQSPGSPGSPGSPTASGAGTQGGGQVVPARRNRDKFPTDYAPSFVFDPAVSSVGR